MKNGSFKDDSATKKWFAIAMLNYQRLILINKITKDPGLFPRTRNQPGAIKELCSDAPRSNPQAPMQLLREREREIYIYYRRKFRSQTSDNIDRWKSRGGKSQRGEEQKREDQRRESEKKEDAGARKGRKAAKHHVFPMICGSGGSKSRLANGCEAIWPDER